MIEGDAAKNLAVPTHETPDELSADEGVIYTPTTEWRSDLWEDGWLVSLTAVDGKACLRWEQLRLKVNA